MLFTRNKNNENSGIINVSLFANKIIFNTGFNIENNELFELNEYKKVLNKCRFYVSELTIKNIEEYFKNNSEIIKNLMKLDKGENQLSLF